MQILLVILRAASAWLLLGNSLALAGSAADHPSGFSNSSDDALIEDPADSSRTIPSSLASRMSRLDPESAAVIATRLEAGLSLAPFCVQGGFVCNDKDMGFVPLQLSVLTSYNFPPSFDTSLEEAVVSGLFFGESRVAPGKTLEIAATAARTMAANTSTNRAFLPPVLVEALRPFFCVEKLPQLLRQFGFSVGSGMARSMEETLRVCGAAPAEGETKACVSSFEEMADLAASVSRSSDLEILASGAGLYSLAPPDLLYDQAVAIKRIQEIRAPAVACHSAMFPFQVFYCHYLQGSKVLKMDLSIHNTRSNAADNSSLKGFTVSASCHNFHALHIKFKDSPVLRLLEDLSNNEEFICHWNFGDNVVWVPRTDSQSRF